MLLLHVMALLWGILDNDHDKDRRTVVANNERYEVEARDIAIADTN